MHYYNGGFWAFGLMHEIGEILFIGLLVWFFVWLFGGRRHRRWGGPGMWQSHNALTILNERYAKGEISKEEYEERRRTLMGT